MTHDQQIVEAKENLKLSYGGPIQRQKKQAPTNGLKLYARIVIESDATATCN